MKLLIQNKCVFHYEIIESVIVKCRDILNINDKLPIDIYLAINKSEKQKDFEKYIRNKYPKIKFKSISDYDYFINCTIYDGHFKNLDKKRSNKKYISHEVTDRLKQNPNVFF